MTTLSKQGEILERLVRRDRMGISELSRRLNVSRRTIYNWFAQERIDIEIIYRVGYLLGQDLFSFFPGSSPEHNLSHVEEISTNPDIQSGSDSKELYLWMNKYIQLLEKYNDLLLTKEKLSSKPAMTYPFRKKKAELIPY